MTGPDEVVLGLVLRQGRLLVQRRLGDPGLGEVWELPGGKRTASESREAAVAREVLEETGLRIVPRELLLALSHVYPDRRVSLYAYICDPADDPGSSTGRAAIPSGAEWVELARLRSLPVPAGDPPILDALERWSLRA